MKDSVWKIKKETQAFDRAKENMAWDEAMLNDCGSNERIERFYIWKQPGITYSFKQDCPTQMQALDHAIRVTGGGIVFHSPGDVVFSIISSTGDPDYSKKPKKKLDDVSKRIAKAIESSGIALESSPVPIPKDMTYCQSYPTPFEIIYDGKKICGLTIRQYKDKWLIQGIIHAQKTSPLFYPYIMESQRIATTLDAIQIRDYLINH